MAEYEEKDIDLSYYFNLILRRRWVFLSIWLSVALISALITVSMRKVYMAQSLVVIEKERGNNSAYQGVPMIERDDADYYQTQYKLLVSNTLLTTVYKELELQKYEDFAHPGGFGKLQKAVEISPVPRSRLVYVRVESHDPLIAAVISNKIADTYIKQNLSNQLFISKEVLAALQQTGAGQKSQQLFESLPAVVNSPLIQNLKQEAAVLEGQVAQLSARYTARHPQIISAKAHLQSIKAQIRQETDKIVRSIKIDLSGQLLGNNIRMIDPAQVPLEPVKPKRALNLIIGIIAGFILGLLSAMIVDAIDQTVRTQEDVENKLDTPFLGVVPFVATPKDAPVYQPLTTKEQSLTGESIRNLRTMIDFAEVSQDNKSFLTTSTVQGEGKSYICANLAVSIALAGEKTLLIDGDLRRSSVHKIFRISNSAGLSDFLVKSDNLEDVKNFIQKSDVENLDILPCGPRPPNPAELLNTPKVAGLVDWAHKNYDRVIIDCPPMFPISDTLLWGRHLPNCIYIVKFAKTRVPLLTTGIKRIKGADIKLLGISLNMSKSGGLSYAYDGYYYKYNYNYYYRDEKEDGHSPAKSAKPKNS